MGKKYRSYWFVGFGMSVFVLGVMVFRHDVGNYPGIATVLAVMALVMAVLSVKAP